MVVRKDLSREAWSIVETKTHLDEVIERAEEGGPQRLERHGDELGVFVSPEDWGPGGPTRKGTLLEFFQNSPLCGLDLDLERHPDTVEDLRTYDIFEDDTIESFNDMPPFGRSVGEPDTSE